MKIFSDELISMLENEYIAFKNIHTETIGLLDAQEIKLLVENSLVVHPFHFSSKEFFTHEQKNFFSRKALQRSTIRHQIYDRLVEELNNFRAQNFSLEHGKFYIFSPAEYFDGRPISSGKFLAFFSCGHRALFEIQLSDKQKIYHPINVIGKQNFLRLEICHQQENPFFIVR